MATYRRSPSGRTGLGWADEKHFDQAAYGLKSVLRQRSAQTPHGVCYTERGIDNLVSAQTAVVHAHTSGNKKLHAMASKYRDQIRNRLYDCMKSRR
jgi:hypothetical protein